MRCEVRRTTGIVDRSEKGIRLTEQACRAEIERGTVTTQQADVEHFELPTGMGLFDLAFACRVGVLDGRHPDAFDAALASVRAATLPGALLYLDTGAPLRAVALRH